MKWKNKGHEFDTIAAEYCTRFAEKQIFIFGAGEVGAKYAPIFHHFDLLDGFIDNDEKKHGVIYCGKQTISLFDYMNMPNRETTMIVVCVSAMNYEQILPQLLQNGLREGQDFVWHDNYDKKIFPILLAYSRQKIFLPLVQISLTERCTLRCKKCAHACNLVPSNAEDLPLKEACHSADMLFSFVDYVQDFVLIGGEPFLYKELGEVIEYIGKKYRDKIYSFSITTNGTITPPDNLLKLCKRYNMLVRISNYAKALPRLERQYEKMTDALKQNGITFLLGNKDIDWMDYGFEYVDRKGTPEQLAAVFDACATPCHEVRGDKFYYCVMARSVSENMQRNVGEGDYLDLSELKTGVDNKIFFEYIMGYSEKGYLDMCNYCHGVEARQYPISIAEQMK